MFGCLRRLGCLVVILAAAVLYLSRDLWRPLLARTSGRNPEAAPETVQTWQPLSQAAAERGERAVRALAARRGPVYVSLRAGELASYAFLSLSDALPASLRDAETAVVGDRVYVRAVVSPEELPGGGALRTVLTRRDTLRLGGTFDVLRPGLAQFRVRDVQVGALPLPAAVIPRVVARVRRGAVPAGVDDDAFPVPVPDYIGDVRIARGRVTLYKAGPTPTPTPP
jgi:hypothetical protein